MNKNNPQRIIILSDLWGKDNSEWMNYYNSILENHFVVKYYDSCVLGEIDKSEYTEGKLHHQFINGGIETAVKNLIKEESESSIILGFSIGGTIVWQACIAGLKTHNLIAVSSTRLRLETQKPSNNILLIYGEQDAYKPDKNWFDKIGIDAQFLKDEGHDLYKNQEIAEKICKMILKQ